jgi:hypothetical protein
MSQNLLLKITGNQKSLGEKIWWYFRKFLGSPESSKKLHSKQNINKLDDSETLRSKFLKISKKRTIVLSPINKIKKTEYERTFFNKYLRPPSMAKKGLNITKRMIRLIININFSFLFCSEFAWINFTGFEWIV